MDNINKKIIDIKYKMLKKEQMLRHQLDLTEQIASEKGSLERLKRELEKEQGDVSRLEGISIGAILQNINGGKDLRLEKEKADVARAALDYKQKQGDIEFLEYELNLLENQLKDYASLDRDLEEYMELKKKMMPAEIRNLIKNMEAECTSLQLKNREIKEAKQAAEKVSSSLNAIIDYMNAYMEDATDLIFNYPDHEELTEMSNEVRVFKGLWQSFKQELKDTDIVYNISDDDLLLESFSEFVYTQEEEKAIVEDYVRRSYHQLTSLYGDIKEILQLLKKTYETNAYRIDELEMDMKKAIEEN